MSLVLSHTQLEAAVDAKTGCWRRWWFFWGPPKLPKVRRTTQTFGEVGHGIVERWLKCDDLGNGPELYPEGWALTLNPAEQDLIKRLIEEAIVQGVIRRVPGRLVEHEFSINGGTIVGKIDFAVVAGGIGEVTDHKFLKSLRYAPSKESLKNSGQHLLYVNAMAEYLHERNEVVPDQWDIAVNAFSKDPDDFRVKRIVARVSLAEARAWWDRVIPPALEAAAGLKANGKTAADWRDIPGPKDAAKACNAYGGCAARAICAGAETVPAFTKRIQRLNDVSGGEVSSKVDEKRIVFQRSDMGKLFDERIKNRMAQVPASSPPPFPKEEPEPVQGAPWADPECRACSGSGISTKGEPCGPCVGVAYIQKRMNDLPHLFDLASDGNGSVTWTRKGAVAAPEAVPITGAPAPNAKPKVVEAVAAPVEPIEPDPIEPDEEKRGRGRPKKGITLYLDCQPIKGRTKVRRISEVLTHYGDQILGGKYYEAEVWSRRDLIRINADLIASDLGTSTIAAFGLTEMPDERVLYEALEPYATEVIAAVGLTRIATQ